MNKRSPKMSHFLFNIMKNVYLLVDDSIIMVIYNMSIHI